MSRLSVRRAVTRAVAVTAAYVASFHAVNAQTIRGTVFDSLTMRPIAGASVWVEGAAQSAIADSTGHFELVGVAAGERFIAFSSPALDSLGLGTLGVKRIVAADNASLLQLASPSFATIARAFCRGTVFASDSGIAWGTVRDATTEIRLANARTTMEWSVPTVGVDKKISMSTGSREVRTDATGTYFACGVPVETAIAMEASGMQSSSGILQFSVGPRRVLRVDISVSKEMADLSAARNAVPTKDAKRAPIGTASLSGTVHDDKQRAVGSATITIASLDTVFRSDPAGKFLLNGLPAGTQMLEVRQVGLAARTLFVDLTPGKTTDVAVLLSTLSELEAVKVTAAREATRDREGFEERSRTGFGYMRTQKDFAKNYDLVAAIQTLPSMSLKKTRGVISVATPREQTMQSPCKVKVWLDGARSSFDEIDAIGIDDLRAIEWYPSASRTPAKFMPDCATLVLWTVRSNWGK